MDLPEPVVNHLMEREYRARFLQALFEENPYAGINRTVDHRKLANHTQNLTRAGLVDAIALARQRMAKDLVSVPGLHSVYLEEFERMAEGMVARLFPEG